MKIQFANEQQAPMISELIHGLSHYFTVKPDGSGAAHFLQSITPDAIRNYILDSGFVYITATENGELAGVAALKGGTHVFHLFVAAPYQKRGLATQLWKALQAYIDKKANEITVNSTLFAEPVYQRFGFVAQGERVERNGVAYISMRKMVRNDPM